MKNIIRGRLITLLVFGLTFAIVWKTPSWTNDGYNIQYNSSKNNGVVVFSGEYDNGTKTADFEVDLTNGQKQKVTISGTDLAMTLTGLSSVEVGNFLIKIVQSAGGSDTINWASGNVIKFAGGTDPTLTTTANAVDILSVYFDGTSYYGGVGLDYK